MTGLFAGALRRCRVFISILIVTGAVSACATSGGSIEEAGSRRWRPTTEKYAAIVVDAKSGRMLYVRQWPNRDALPGLVDQDDDRLHAVRSHGPGPHSAAPTLIPISRNAAARPPSKLGLKAGQSIPGRHGDTGCWWSSPAK